MYAHWVKWQTELPLQFIYLPISISPHPPGYIVDFKYVKCTYNSAPLFFFIAGVVSYPSNLFTTMPSESDPSKIEICYSSASVAPHNQQDGVLRTEKEVGKERWGGGGVGKGGEGKDRSRGGEGQEQGRGRNDNFVCIIGFTSQKACHSNLSLIPNCFQFCISVSLSFASPSACNTPTPLFTY